MLNFFTSAGNHDEETDFQVQFPANLTFVHGVGAIYDYEVPDGYNMGDKTDFSNYGETLNESAPGYNIETVRYNSYSDEIESIKVSGTSYSAPIAALTFAYLKYAAKVLNKVLNLGMNNEMIRELVDKAFKYAMEKQTRNRNT